MKTLIILLILAIALWLIWGMIQSVQKLRAREKQEEEKLKDLLSYDKKPIVYDTSKNDWLVINKSQISQFKTFDIEGEQKDILIKLEIKRNGYIYQYITLILWYNEFIRQIESPRQFIKLDFVECVFDEQEFNSKMDDFFNPYY